MASLLFDGWFHNIVIIAAFHCYIYYCDIKEELGVYAVLSQLHLSLLLQFWFVVKPSYNPTLFNMSMPMPTLTTAIVISEVRLPPKNFLKFSNIV